MLGYNKELENTVEKGVECYAKWEYANAIHYFREAANKGYPRGWYYLARAYDEGKGVPINKKKVTELYNLIKTSAKEGNVIGQNNLGHMYEKGLGVEKDYKRAREWYQKAADQGYPRAQCNLGRMYDGGLGVEKDYKRAREWYQKAAAQGQREAQCNLGRMYELSLGVETDYKKACEWYQKAANQGLPGAQYNLGRMYENARGVKGDYKKACEWYQKAANQGLSGAQYNLGRMYENARGVKRDYKKACEWYQKAANQDLPDAQYNLGRMYELGLGVETDYKKACEWYQKAADQDLPDAQYNLGRMYEHGQGVVKNDSEAFSWYQKAANQDLPDAQYNLGRMYELGLGVVEDKKMAIFWYEKAASQGHTSAQSKLDDLYKTHSLGRIEIRNPNSYTKFILPIFATEHDYSDCSPRMLLPVIECLRACQSSITEAGLSGERSFPIGFLDNWYVEGGVYTIQDATEYRKGYSIYRGEYLCTRDSSFKIDVGASSKGWPDQNGRYWWQIGTNTDFYWMKDIQRGWPDSNSHYWFIIFGPNALKIEGFNQSIFCYHGYESRNASPWYPFYHYAIEYIPYGNVRSWCQEEINNYGNRKIKADHEKIKADHERRNTFYTRLNSIKKEREAECTWFNLIKDKLLLLEKTVISFIENQEIMVKSNKDKKAECSDRLILEVIDKAEKIDQAIFNFFAINEYLILLSSVCEQINAIEKEVLQSTNDIEKKTPKSATFHENKKPILDCIGRLEKYKVDLEAIFNQQIKVCSQSIIREIRDCYTIQSLLIRQTSKENVEKYDHALDNVKFKVSLLKQHEQNELGRMQENNDKFIRQSNDIDFSIKTTETDIQRVDDDMSDGDNDGYDERNKKRKRNKMSYEENLRVQKRQRIEINAKHAAYCRGYEEKKLIVEFYDHFLTLVDWLKDTVTKRLQDLSLEPSEEGISSTVNDEIPSHLDDQNKPSTSAADPEYTNEMIITLLVQAIESMQLVKLNRVIQRFNLDAENTNINVFLEGKYSENMWTPLHLAVEMRNVDIVERLMALGPNLNEQDFYGNTPLFLATKSGNIEMIQILLEYGADSKIPNDEEISPLTFAYTTKNSKLARLFEKSEGGETEDCTESQGLPTTDQTLKK
jgi:TPR repeat protein